MDIKTKEQRSFNMSKIKSKITKPEIIMFRLLLQKRIKFLKHHKMSGNPDIVFPKSKTAVFINGEFWHGKDFLTIKNTISEFWINKIGRNIQRDRFVQKKLRKDEWQKSDIK